MAFGMAGPVSQHWGLQWRKVRLSFSSRGSHLINDVAHRAGIYIEKISPKYFDWVSATQLLHFLYIVDVSLSTSYANYLVIKWINL